MMEAVDPAVEAAVLWLVETILGVLLGDKMQAWIRQVGLADEIEGLKSEIERAEAAVAAVKGRATENKPLARSLCRLKEMLYDADDMVDELDYYRLQHQVEGGSFAWANQFQDTDATDGAQLVDGSRDNSGIPNRKKRSKAWEDFRVTEDADGKPMKAECIHCHTAIKCETSNGTSVLRNHLKSDSCKRKRAAIGQTPNHSRVADVAQNGATAETHDSDSRKRMRIDEGSAHNAGANAHPWDKNDFCNRIQHTSCQLQKAVSEVKLYGSSSVESSNPCQSTAADPCRRTSSLVQSKIYGRVAEKNSILQVITKGTSDGVLILPIVGIGGIGKTALAQLVYNDPVLKKQFDHRIWIWVSKNFDMVRLTIEMLDFVSQEKHAGISSLAKLQEILVSHVTSKRCLLILDDVWDDMDDHTWNKLLAPMQSDNKKSNAILVTTRKLSIANAVGTVEPIKLGALQNEDFSLLFKACAFGDDNHEGHPSLNITGRQIADKLYGNPLAAKTVGILLRAQLTIDHWNDILKNEKWKSLHLSRGIMSALKLSYDELPYYLQQCFLCCSIFPNNHQFPCNDLINIWISQGFVKCGHSVERLEETGRDYLTDLVNLCFFEQVEAKEPSTDDEPCYVMPDLVHDFARLVSRTQCAAIDGLECNEMLPTIRHLSILTDSVYHKDKHGIIVRDMKFEEKMRCLGTSVRKLRSLVLIGKYNSFFVQSFQDVFQKAPYLRVLQISATHTDFDLFLHKLVCSTHLRYVKLREKENYEALPIPPIPLRKFHHLQVIDVGNSALSNDMNGLVSMRHLAVEKGTHFTDQHSICFEMAQIQMMSELVQLAVHQLQNVNGAEACRAKLRDKQHLEKLHLLWNYTEPYRYAEAEEESWPMNGVSNSITSEQFTDAAREVLQGLEPNRNLKHLRISGYSGATSPNWLSSIVSVTCLQTLHLEDCREWQVLPSLEILPFLTKLKLRNMWKVTEVKIPSLEELVLIKMPKLERCSCNSMRDLNSSIRVLVIKKCHELKVFPLFESCGKFRIEQKSWLSSLSKLTVHDCPQLIVSNPLPPSSSSCELSIARVSTLPTMEGSSKGELIIGADRVGDPDEDSNMLIELDDKILSFDNLRMLTDLRIEGCKNLSFISPSGLKQFVSLKSLEIIHCYQLFSSDVLPEHAREEMADTNFKTFPALKRLSIIFVGIPGKWLSVMLSHAPVLEEVEISACDQTSGLLIEGGESCLSNHNSIPRSSSHGHPDDASTSSSPEALLHSDTFPALFGTSVTYLQTLHLEDFRELQELPSLTRLPFLTKLKLRNMWKVTEVSFSSLEELVLIKMPKLERCSCNSMRNLNSSLRVLVIKKCHELKVFPLFESCGKFRIEQKSWLSSLSKLTVHDCPQLIVSNPLPPSSSSCELSIARVSTLPTMEGSSKGELIIGADRVGDPDEDSNMLIELDDKILSFDNLRMLTDLRIEGCKNLSFISPSGLKQFVSLKSLEIIHCYQLFSSDVLPEHAREEMADTNFKTFPALKRLSIIFVGIPGKWLSVMLSHAPVLEEVEISACDQTSGLLIEGGESCLSNHNSIPRSSSHGHPDDASTSSSPEALLHSDTFPALFGTSVTYLQTLHLEDFRELQELPSLTRLPFLTKLKLRNMWKVTEVSFSSLEELVLIKMPKLERCSCNSMRNLNSSLRVLVIKKCHELKVFPLFESCGKFRIEQKSWLSSLSKLNVHDCPQLIVSNPLPPSSSSCELSIKRVSTLPTMEGSSKGFLVIGDEQEVMSDEDSDELIELDDKVMPDEDSNELIELDDKILSFDNLRMLTDLHIRGCKNLSFISPSGLKQFVCLKSLKIKDCCQLFSSDVLPEHAREEMADTDFKTFPALKCLSIIFGGIPGKWLSVMLRHAPVLEEVEMSSCDQISGLLIEETESCLSNHNSIPRSSSHGHPDDASTSSSPETLLRIPSNFLSSSLKTMTIKGFKELVFRGNKEGFSALASLELLEITDCPKLISSLQLYPLGSPNCLKGLYLNEGYSDLESLDLNSCTALEELVIEYYYRLTALEGVQSLRGLRYLNVYGCPRLPLFLERLSGQVNELFPRLDRLGIDDYSYLTESFCTHLSSLQRLDFWGVKAAGSTNEQERALQLLTSLQDLRFSCCENLTDLPVGLTDLTSLKRLEINNCRRISRLPEKGLPPSLEEQVIDNCSQELTEQCRGLATTGMIKVKIDGRHVNCWAAS